VYSTVQPSCRGEDRNWVRRGWNNPALPFITYNARREGRVLSFFFSRRWTPPTPHPLASVPPPPPPVLGGGAHSLVRELWGKVPIPTRGHTLRFSLYKRTFCHNVSYKPPPGGVLNVRPGPLLSISLSVGLLALMQVSKTMN
jgi:hypothetical protein